MSTSEDRSPLRKFYETHYAKLEGDDQSRTQRLAFATRALSGNLPLANARLLDVGCGIGSNLIQICHQLEFDSPFLGGVEISQAAVQAARERGIDARCVDVNTDVLPFSDESFDAVLFMEAIEHLWNSDMVMREIHRVLRDGGIIILTTPNLASWANRMALLLGFQPPSLEISLVRGFGLPPGVTSGVGHIKAFTRRALLEYMRYCGFDVWMVGSSVAGGVRGFIALVDQLFAKFPGLSSHTLVAGKRVAQTQAPAP